VQSRLWALGYLWGAPRVGPAELQRLRAVHAAHAAAIERGDIPAVIAAAPEFHRVMVEASGNRELVRVALDRMALIQRFVTLCAPELANARALGHHRKMLKALERGDAAAAVAIYEEVSGGLVDAARTLRDQAAARLPRAARSR
jgi:DNA-binding GntR family transcriptional regulator